jgi:hypothetical protein
MKRRIKLKEGFVVAFLVDRRSPHPQRVFAGSVGGRAASRVLPRQPEPDDWRLRPRKSGQRSRNRLQAVVAGRSHHAAKILTKSVH